MGLGYVVEDISHKYPNTQICIIEPNLMLAIELLSTIDYSSKKYIAESKIFISPSKDVIIQYLYKSQFKKITNVITQTAKQLFDDAKIKDFKQEIKTYAQRLQININSIKKYQYRWQANIIRNCLSSKDFFILDNLKNAFQNTPVLLCAGGPSLENCIPYLSQLKEKCLLICVDTALPVLHKNNIPPDFIVVADPQYINTKHLEFGLSWAMSQGACLIMDISTNTRVLHICPTGAPIFTVYSKMPLVEFLFRGMNMGYRPKSGGSIATLALEICNFFGAKNIYTTGLDLSYPNKQSHAKETYFEKHTINQSHRLSPIEDRIIKRFSNQAPHRKVEGFNKKNIYTDTRLLEYKKWLEQYIAHNQHIDFFCLVDYIGNIEGMKLSSIHHILDLPSCRNKIDIKKRKITQSNSLSNHKINKHLYKKNIAAIFQQIIYTHDNIDQLKCEIDKDRNYEKLGHQIEEINLILQSNVLTLIQFFYREEIPLSIKGDMLSQSQEEIHKYLITLLDIIADKLLILKSIIQRI